MITHEINRSGDSSVAPEAHSFHLEPADRAAMERFMMPADELLEELRGGANLARSELQSAMFGVLKASLIGVGLAPVDAHGKAFGLLHGHSLSVARDIVLKVLDAE